LIFAILRSIFVRYGRRGRKGRENPLRPLKGEPKRVQSHKAYIGFAGLGVFDLKMIFITAGATNWLWRVKSAVNEIRIDGGAMASPSPKILMREQWSDDLGYR